jgi:hypothetical protein
MPLMVVDGVLLLADGFPSTRTTEMLSLRFVEQLTQSPKGHGTYLTATYFLPQSGCLADACASPNPNVTK